MHILTVENEAYQLDNIPTEVEDIRYCVLDYTDKDNVDYMFVPLVFLESFNSPAVVLRIKGKEFTMPLDWSIVIGDREIGDPEVIPIMHLNDRGFSAFTFNPLKDFTPAFLEIEVVNVYNEVKWYFPKLKYGHFLAVPSTNDPKDPIMFFVKETNKVPEVLDINQLW